MKLLLVRHGQSEYNAGLSDKFNSKITQKGVDQAARAGMSLRAMIGNERFFGLTSPYMRCLQTANIIAAHTDVKFKVLGSLGETPNELHAKDAYVYCEGKIYPGFDWTLFKSWNYSNESNKSYVARIEEFVNYLGDENYLVVSHMTPIMDIVKKICGDKYDDLTIKNCSITLIENSKAVFIGLVP